MGEVLTLSEDEWTRWDEFVSSHARGTIYHTTAWLRAIQKAYGCTPVYHYLEDDKKRIRACLPSFLIKSSLTGSRLSSIPCGQSCDPLFDDPSDFEKILAVVLEIIQRGVAGHFELKTDSDLAIRLPISHAVSNDHATYRLCLKKPLKQIYNTFHKGQTIRSIKKAKESDLICVSNNHDTSSLRRFYELYLIMRRRYGLLPQPYRFFRAIHHELSPKGQLEIVCANLGAKTTSAILLLKHGKRVTYEYGATDPAYLSLRPSHLLLWNAIQSAHADGYEEFDFGRTSFDNQGLHEFKSRWGTRKVILNYYYLPNFGNYGSLRSSQSSLRAMKYFMHSMPKIFCECFGTVLYRHLL